MTRHYEIPTLVTSANSGTGTHKAITYSSKECHSLQPRVSFSLALKKKFNCPVFFDPTISF